MYTFRPRRVTTSSKGRMSQVILVRHSKSNCLKNIFVSKGSTVECSKDGGSTYGTLKTTNRNLRKNSELTLSTRNGPDVVVDQSSPQNNPSPRSMGKQAGTLIAEIQVSVFGQRKKTYRRTYSYIFQNDVMMMPFGTKTSTVSTSYINQYSFNTDKTGFRAS